MLGLMTKPMTNTKFPSMVLVIGLDNSTYQLFYYILSRQWSSRVNFL